MTIGRNRGKRVVEDLRKGIPCEDLVEQYTSDETVALRKLKAAVDEVGSDGYSVVRFLRGAYGSGKSHTLALLASYALRRRFLVSRMAVSREHTFSKIERTLRELVRNLRAPKMRKRERRPGLLVAIDTWASKLGIEEVPHAVDSLGVDPSCSDMKRALTRIVGGLVNSRRGLGLPRDVEIAYLWLAAEKLRSDERKLIGVHSNVDKNNARDVLEDLARVFRAMAFKGWLLIVDEQEAVSTLLAPRQRDHAISNLRMIMDSASRVEGLMWVFASTPEFFEDPQHGIGTYDALRDRITDNIVLRTSELSTADLSCVGQKVLEIYAAAYPESAPGPSVEELGLCIRRLEDDMQGHLAKPRFFVEAVVGGLDALREGTEQSFSRAFDTVRGRAYQRWARERQNASREDS